MAYRYRFAPSVGGAHAPIPAGGSVEGADEDREPGVLLPGDIVASEQPFDGPMWVPLDGPKNAPPAPTISVSAEPAPQE